MVGTVLVSFCEALLYVYIVNRRKPMRDKCLSETDLIVLTCTFKPYDLIG